MDGPNLQLGQRELFILESKTFLQLLPFTADIKKVLFKTRFILFTVFFLSLFF